MTLRAAQGTDAAPLAALSIEVWLNTYLREGVSAFFADYALETFTPSHFNRVLAEPDETIIVSQNTVGIDGYVRISRNRTAPVSGCGSVEISSLYVQPRHHGRAIGQALLNAAIKHAKSLQVKDIWLTTNAENSPAIGFYLKNGFEKIGETTFDIRDQSYLNNVYRLIFSH